MARKHQPGQRLTPPRGPWFAGVGRIVSAPGSGVRWGPHLLGRKRGPGCPRSARACRPVTVQGLRKRDPRMTRMTRIRRRGATRGKGHPTRRVTGFFSYSRYSRYSRVFLFALRERSRRAGSAAASLQLDRLLVSGNGGLPAELVAGVGEQGLRGLRIAVVEEQAAGRPFEPGQPPPQRRPVGVAREAVNLLDPGPDRSR